MPAVVSGFSRSRTIQEIRKDMGAEAARQADRSAAIDIACEKAEAKAKADGSLVGPWEVRSCSMLRQHEQTGKCRWYVLLSADISWNGKIRKFRQGVLVTFKDEIQIMPNVFPDSGVH